MKTAELQDLKSLPNVGDHLSKMINLVGIHTPEELVHTGTEETFLRIRQIDPGACLSMLCAIDGAIRGKRWHLLPPARREELKLWLEDLRKR